MTHEEFRTHLSGYIDGELAEEMRAEMDAHVQTCDDCRVVLVTLQKSIELSRGQDAPKLSKAFQDQLTQQVQRTYRLSKRCEG